jgi:hypothetical protein
MPTRQQLTPPLSMSLTISMSLPMPMLLPQSVPAPLPLVVLPTLLLRLLFLMIVQQLPPRLNEAFRSYFGVRSCRLSLYLGRWKRSAHSEGDSFWVVLLKIGPTHLLPERQRAEFR